MTTVMVGVAMAMEEMATGVVLTVAAMSMVRVVALSVSVVVGRDVALRAAMAAARWEMVAAE